jgi:hypothetical protein
VSTVRYYDGLEVRPDREVDAEAARAASTSARAVFGAGDRLERVELYDGGRLFRVEYEDADERTIADAHRRDYANVPFAIRRLVRREGALSWEAVRVYTASGRFEDCTLILQDGHEQARMEVTMNAGGEVVEVAKYEWEDSKLRYIFSYEGTGDLVAVTDLDDGDTVLFDDLRPYLADPDFYAGALTLPRELAGGSIPDCT